MGIETIAKTLSAEENQWVAGEEVLRAIFV